MFKTRNSFLINFLETALSGICVAFCLCLVSQPLFSQAVDFDKSSLIMRDRLLFRNGSELFGTVKSEGVDDEGRKYVVFETDDQTVMKLDVARLLSKPPQKADAADLAYNKRIANMPDTAEAHREVYKWCEDQPGGKDKFRERIKFHNERVMELDPNDTAVRHRLNYEFIEEEDRWVPEELYYKSLGYERKGTSWAPTLRRDVENREDQAQSAEADRRVDYRKWKNTFKRMTPTQAQAELIGICDQVAVPFLFEEAKEEKDLRIQAMFVEAFGRVPSYAAMEALIYFSIEGRAPISDRALDLLLQDHYNASAASARIAGQYFTANSNYHLQRAAFAVGELGSENMILPLIGILVTEHVVAPGEQPGRMQSTFNNNGIQSFSAGGDSKPTKVTIPNDAVVAALNKITSQDFQFSSEAWKQWYIKNHTLYDQTLRPVRR